jgi:hypothetical protein
VHKIIESKKLLMKYQFLFVLFIVSFKGTFCQISPQKGKPQSLALQQQSAANAAMADEASRISTEDLVDTKILFSSGGNNLDFVPLSSFNNGLLIQPNKQVTGNGIPTSFYNGPGGSWAFYTNTIKRFDIDENGHIKTSNAPLLINGANPEESYSMKVHGNVGFDSSVVLGEVSDSTSFISMNMGFKNTFNDIDDTKSPYSNTPTAWAQGKKLPVFRLRHPNNVANAGNPNISNGKDFMILPYQYGMAIEYNGVVECWVGEWSIHRGNTYNDIEAQGNGWGGVLWVGDDHDLGGVRGTARNNLADGGNVNYGELSVEKFGGSPNGDFRLRLPSTNNQFQFVYGGRGSTNIVAKVSDKGFFMPTVSSSSAIVTPEKGQVYFDSTSNDFKGYNGSEWVGLSNNYITGSYITSSDDGTVYQIPHGIGAVPSYFNVLATSADAGNIKYVTADNTYLKVYYSVAPPAGVNNLSWNWQVKK